MGWKQGDVFKCPDPNCACEVTVSKAPKPGMGGDQPPTCCCGKRMQRQS